MGTVSSAQATGRETVKERAARARKACLAGDYATAVSLLSELFVETKDPNHIYNQGRCFEQNGRYADAILRFREYLRSSSGISQEERSGTEQHIADCEALLAKENGQPGPAPAAVSPSPVAPPSVAPPSLAPEPAPPVIVAREVQPVAEAPAESGLRTAGLVVAGAGGVALVTGLIFNLKANGIAHDYGNPGGYTDSKESDRKTYETVAWVGYGVGAACVATGAALYFWGRAAGAPSSVALLPLVGSDRGGAVLQGAF